MIINLNLHYVMIYAAKLCLFYIFFLSSNYEKMEQIYNAYYCKKLY
jgi:hypothetical protein